MAGLNPLTDYEKGKLEDLKNRKRVAELNWEREHVGSKRNCLNGDTDFCKIRNKYYAQSQLRMVNGQARVVGSDYQNHPWIASLREASKMAQHDGRLQRLHTEVNN
jgi:hypothetical protein